MAGCLPAVCTYSDTGLPATPWKTLPAGGLYGSPPGSFVGSDDGACVVVSVNPTTFWPVAATVAATAVDAPAVAAAQASRTPATRSGLRNADRSPEYIEMVLRIIPGLYCRDMSLPGSLF